MKRFWLLLLPLISCSSVHAVSNSSASPEYLLAGCVASLSTEKNIEISSAPVYACQQTQSQWFGQTVELANDQSFKDLVYEYRGPQGLDWSSLSEKTLEISIQAKASQMGSFVPPSEMLELKGAARSLPKGAAIDDIFNDYAATKVINAPKPAALKINGSSSPRNDEETYSLRIGKVATIVYSGGAIPCSKSLLVNVEPSMNVVRC